MADTDMIPSSSSSSYSADGSSIDDENHPISEEACKKAKMADTSTTTVGGDFISGLPDAILCDILSYVPTKYAVSTSVLSKRWNQVWTSVPNLDLCWQCRSDAPPVNETHFMNFVDKVLSLNNVSRVRNIYLHCNNNCDFSRVNAWMNVIITRDSDKFTLKIPRACLLENLDQSSRIHSLPDSFYTRNNLVQLSLKCIALKVPVSVNFPSLKTIFFNSVQLLDDDSMKNLLFGCPVLLTLYINRRAWDNAQTLYISSTTLGSLSMHTQYCDKDVGNKVVIDTPNLRILTLTDEVDADYDIINLSSLVKVKVSIELEGEGRVQTDEDVFYVRLFELLGKISHVKDLCFASGTMRSFQYTSLENLPKFNNLTHMKVELIPDGWSILPALFHSAPNLVTYVLEKEYTHPDCAWYQPNEVPQCFLSSLEYVEIENFEDRDDMMKLIYYFLKNAMVLKNLSISSFNLELKKETDILKELLTLPRSSSICQVEYTNSKL